jgi:copper(I)-binding protein
MTRRPLFLLFALLSVLMPLGSPALAQTTAVTVTDAWARPTVAGQPVGGGYLTLRGGSAADRLLSASSAVAASVELHSMAMEGDVMRMRPVDGIAVPAGGTVELKPGGLHLMLMGLKQPLAAGSKLPLTLRFEKAGELQVELVVGQRAAAPAAAKDGHGHKH